MRKWGIVISVFYAGIVLFLLVPVGMMLAGDTNSLTAIYSRDLEDVYTEWLAWVPIAAVVVGQAVLLFLSVDTSFRKLKPRAHVAVSVTAAAMLCALLIFAGLSALGAAVYSDKFIDNFWTSATEMIAVWAGIWAIWAVLFALYCRNTTDVLGRAVSWLLKGSVLELLIAVPCHVIVRRRHDCSAPVVTSFGIVTGIAVMLLSFGPSVLFLFKKRLDAYSTQKSA